MASFAKRIAATMMAEHSAGTRITAAYLRHRPPITCIAAKSEARLEKIMAAASAATAIEADSLRMTHSGSAVAGRLTKAMRNR